MDVKTYHPLDICEKNKILYEIIKNRFGVAKSELDNIINALYDAYMDQRAFEFAKKEFLKEENISYLPDSQYLVYLSKKVNEGKEEIYKQQLLKVFWNVTLRWINKKELTEAIDMVFSMFFSQKWSPSKQVFVFDPDMKKQLLELELPEIAQATILENLPFESFYIDMNKYPIVS